MKKTWVAAVFLLVGGGAVGVGAFSNITLHGSQELKDFTLRLLDPAICPGAVGLNYNVVESLDVSIEDSLGLRQGEFIFPPTQQTGPMSRFLRFSDLGNSDNPIGDACHAIDPTKAAGIAFAADGVGIAVSKVHAACDANSTTGSDCSKQLTTGLRNSGTLNGGAYTLGAGNPVLRARLARRPPPHLPRSARHGRHGSGWHEGSGSSAA